jgi:hypothetical protein
LPGAGPDPNDISKALSLGVAKPENGDFPLYSEEKPIACEKPGEELMKFAFTPRGKTPLFQTRWPKTARGPLAQPVRLE